MGPPKDEPRLLRQQQTGVRGNGSSRQSIAPHARCQAWGKR